ncbi:MAG: PIN domain-containing protein [Patescibacteria group bacterium]
MVILDSNIWIAFFNRKDSQHTKARKIFFTIQELVILPEYIILEVCSILTLRASKKIAEAFLEIAIYNKNVKIVLSDDSLFKNTLKLFVQYKGNKLSFVDLALVYMSKTDKIVTFDKNLKKVINH